MKTPMLNEHEKWAVRTFPQFKDRLMALKYVGGVDHNLCYDLLLAFIELVEDDETDWYSDALEWVTGSEYIMEYMLATASEKLQALHKAYQDWTDDKKEDTK